MSWVLHDSATVTGIRPGAPNASSATITFRLYGPHDPSCSSAPAASSTVAVRGDGGYRSANLTVTTPGSYRWVAPNSGHGANPPTPGHCGDPHESTTVKDVDHTTTTLETKAPGEALVALTASAPHTDWGISGRESAVATVTVDGRYSQDVVLFKGAESFTYRLALGWLDAGRHRVHVSYARRKSPSGARGIVVDDLRATMVRGAGALALRYAPILYGRDEPGIGGSYENNHTDVPLLFFHTVIPDPHGTTIAYNVIWSNEDGGTPVDAMMPRWGRTTDIEWIYRVRLDRRGRRVSDAYQDPAHHVHRFHGRRDHDHPLLRTVALNNGVMAVHGRSDESRYRFFMDPSSELAEGIAREAEMDANPWTYAVSAAEAQREHKFERHPSPNTAAISDPRRYLFVRLVKRTTMHSARGWVGTAIDIKLRGSSTWYRSNHGIADWSVQPDGQVTTSIELPGGTAQNDVQAFRAEGAPVGDVRGSWRVRVSEIATAFSLDSTYTPLRWSRPRRVGVTLTSHHRARWIWDLKKRTGA
jgi:hypothetical protein